jgi:hypothetical protein
MKSVNPFQTTLGKGAFGTLCLAMALAGGPAVADNANTAGQNADSGEDRMICKRIGETGSRLRSSRVCMTKAQWDEKRRADRQEIEKGQMQGCMPNAECN